VTEKLSKTNYALWKAQILAAICAARYEGHINRKTEAPDAEFVEKKADDTTVTNPNPAFETWYARDQQILELILSNVRKEVQAQIVTVETVSPSTVGSWRKCTPRRLAPRQ
jgi:hypothetical protein